MVGTRYCASATLKSNTDAVHRVRTDYKPNPIFSWLPLTTGKASLSFHTLRRFLRNRLSLVVLRYFPLRDSGILPPLSLQ